MDLWENAVDTFGDVIAGIGDNFSATATDAQARANYNQAIANLAQARASAEMTRAKETSRAINNAVMGVIIVLGIYVVAKFLVPKLK